MMRILIKFLFCFVLNIALCSFLTKTLFANIDGAPAYNTGAPNEGTCADIDCHDTSPLNSGGATFSITAPAVYTPNQHVNIEVSFSDSIGTLNGFEMTAVDADGNKVGKFKRKGADNQVITPNDYRGLDLTDKQKYIENTAKGAKKTNWKFRWKAPKGATDPITFYASGCDADGDQTAANDDVYTSTAEINAAP